MLREEAFERFVCVETDFEDRVYVVFVGVDVCDHGTVGPGDVGNERRGHDHATRADDDHELCPDGVDASARVSLVWNGLAVQHDCGSLESAARRAGRKRVVRKGRVFAFEMADRASVTPHGAVEPDHVRMSGALVEAVDVLRHEFDVRTLLGPFCEEVMGAAGFAVAQRLTQFQVPRPHRCGIRGEPLRREELLDGLPAPQPACSLEGRYAARGRDPRPGRDQD